MLIACFQCRQSMDVPEDSAGKRVRCPQCQYVIVVPARPTEHGVSAEAPALGMPSLELDDNPGSVSKPAASVPTVPTQSLPPMPLPMPTAPPKSKKVPLDEDEPPARERGARRRTEASAPPPKRGWGRTIAVVALLGVIFAAAGWVAYNVSGPRFPAPAQVAFKAPPQPMPMPQIDMPPIPVENFNPPAFIPMNLNWKEFSHLEGRFRVQFPAEVVKQERVILLPMTAFEARPGEWEFSAAYRVMPEKEYLAVPLDQRFADLKKHLADADNAFVERDIPLNLVNVHPGREWTLKRRDGTGQLHARTYFVRDGNQYRHYLLQARGPRNAARFHPEFDHFLNSFAVLPNVEGMLSLAGTSIFEQIDDFAQGARRDNDFTALALHPAKPLALVGAPGGQMHAVSTRAAGAGRTFALPPLAVKAGSVIEQAVFSKDGVRLAVAAAGKIYRYKQSDQDGDSLEFTGWVRGTACAFTIDHHLVVAGENKVVQYDANEKTAALLEIPDLTIRGLALSSDERTLALWGDEGIVLCDWTAKKVLEPLAAHDGAVTAFAFAPDRKSFASAGVDGAIKLWSLETRTVRATLNQHAWTVSSLAYTSDGLLLSAGLDGMLLAWDLEPKTPHLVWAEAHQFPVRHIAFDTQSKQVYVASKRPVPLGQQPGRQYARQLRKLDWTAVKRDPQAAAKLVAHRAGLHLPTSSLVHISPDAKTIVMTGDTLDDKFNERKLRVYDAATARVLFTHPAMMGGALSPDGKWFAFAMPGPRAIVRILDVEALRILPAPFETEGAGFPMVLFTPDSQSIWVMQRNELTRVDVQNLLLRHQPPLKLKAANDPRFVSILPSGDGKTFLVERFSFNAGLRTRTLHDSTDGKELPLPKLAPGASSAFLRLRRVMGQSIELEDVLQGQSRSVGQQRLAMFGATLAPERHLAATQEIINEHNLKVHLWDLQARRPILTLPETNARSSNQMRFAANGRLLVYSTSAGWTRLVPTDWLLQRKALLPCNPNDVGAP